MSITELFTLTLACGALVALTVELCRQATQWPWHLLEAF